MCSKNENNLKDFPHNRLRVSGITLPWTGQAVPSYFNPWESIEKLTTNTVNFPKRYASCLPTVPIINYLA